MMRSAAASRRDADTPDGWTALGASVQLVVTDPGRLERARAMLETRLTAIDAACNRLRTGSELAALDRRSGDPVQVSPLLADAIAAALRTARLTEGDLDPTVSDAFADAGQEDGDRRRAGQPEPGLRRWSPSSPPRPGGSRCGWMPARVGSGCRPESASTWALR